MTKNDFQYGGWNSYTLQCGTIMTLISSGDCTLQCGMWHYCGSGIVTVNSPSGSTLQCDAWLWDDMPLNSPGGSTMQWHVALESWHWIRQVAAPGNLAGGSAMTCHWIRPNVRHIGILHGFDFNHFTAVDMSFCTSLRNFIQIGPPSAEKNDVMSIFKIADLSHLGF